jgi:hypothetical protein
MGGFEVKREDVAGEVILRLNGTLDEDAALLLKALLSNVEAPKVVIDFAQVKDFYDLSVSVLARTLSQRPVELRGLRTHQARMFEYFGIPAGESERVYYTPEELLVA